MSRMMAEVRILSLLLLGALSAHGFVQPSLPHSRQAFALRSTTKEVSTLETQVAQLKRVLEREYISFFDPMETEYYATDVSFDDPMTSLAGVESYQNNVDMLASRTLMGKILFGDAGIVLHSVKGGEIQEDGSISNIITRWTLRVTAKILPWKPTARFSGISEYEVEAGGPKGVLVKHQTDYWDSINIAQGGEYQKVDKDIAIKDFLGQVSPDNAIAPAAAAEVPYQLLRRGNGYEVRKYPSFSTVKVPYERRDEGFLSLGAFTSGMTPLAPAIMTVQNSDKSKTMMWPLTYAGPGESEDAGKSPEAVKKVEEPRWKDEGMEVISYSSQVVAVGSFSDASLEPVVRKANAALRAACERDGLKLPEDTEVSFAQYDAIYSMGKRRGEVWITIPDGGHPW